MIGELLLFAMGGATAVVLPAGGPAEPSPAPVIDEDNETGTAKFGRYLAPLVGLGAPSGYRCARAMFTLHDGAPETSVGRPKRALATLRRSLEDPRGFLEPADSFETTLSLLEDLKEALPNNQGQVLGVSRVMLTESRVAETPTWSAELLRPNGWLTMVSKYRSETEQAVVSEYGKDEGSFLCHQVMLEDPQEIPTLTNLRSMVYPLYIGNEAATEFPLFQWLPLESTDARIQIFALEHEVWGERKLWLAFDANSHLPVWSAIDIVPDAPGFEQWSAYRFAATDDYGVRLADVIQVSSQAGKVTADVFELADWDFDPEPADYRPAIVEGSQCFDHRDGREAFTSWEAGELWPPDTLDFVEWAHAAPPRWDPGAMDLVYTSVSEEPVAQSDPPLQPQSGPPEPGSGDGGGGMGLQLWAGVLCASAGILLLNRVGLETGRAAHPSFDSGFGGLR